MDNFQKQALLGTLLNSEDGRKKIASSMTQPLRSRRDYASVARKAFLVEQLPDGAIPVYDKDAEVTAYVISDDGENVLSVQKPKRVLFPIFEIVANPEASIMQIKERRFDLIQRMQDNGRSTVQSAEDGRVFEIFDAVAQKGFDTITVASGLINEGVNANAPLTAANIADALGIIEEHDLTPDRIFMNARDFSDVRKWGRDVFDPESQKQLLETGLRGTLYGAKVVISRMVDAGFVYVTATPEFVGRIPVRTEITVLSADDTRRRVIGFSIFEALGIGCHNPLGLVRIHIAR